MRFRILIEPVWYALAMVKRAIIDKIKRYRYTLERYWGADLTNVVNFILLNPSKADETKDDPTVRACVAFAQKWGFDGLIMTKSPLCKTDH